MNRCLSTLLLCLLALGAVAENRVVTTDTHRLEEVAPGVFLAQGTARLFNSNALVIVNDEDILVVDSHITPRKARELQKSIRKVSRNPITTLVNTHFHYDHAHGNQAFGDDVTIIGHEYTRMKMAGKPLEEGTFVRGSTGTAAALDRLKAEYEQDDKAKKKELKGRLDMLSAHVRAWDEIDPVAPSVTLADRMVLFRGSREIQLHFFGRAHTGGDVVVYLPADKLAYTGDMMLGGPSWLGDGYVDEWPQTLENMKSLDLDLIVPGHGGAFAPGNRIELVQAYYRDLWGQASAKFREGVAAEVAAGQIDLTGHKELGILRVGADPMAVGRIYARLQGAM